MIIPPTRTALCRASRTGSSSARASLIYSKQPTTTHHHNKLRTLQSVIMKKLRTIALACAALLAAQFPIRAAETIKVGILHSLSGTMAISETSLRDVLLFAFDEINKGGGVK